MSGSSIDRLVPAALRVELVAAAVTFLLAAPLHLGVRLAGLAEPRIVPAAIVEALCGVSLAVAGVGVVARAPWAWSGALTAHLVSIAGVVLGTVALAAGLGPSTPLNVVYHRVILGVLVVGLVLLVSTPGRRALRGRDGRQARRPRQVA
jgi:hypothetical protein